jgi:thiamine-monophosphate kinase
MIDLADGLVQDLGHILKESGVGAKLELDKIPVSRDALKLARGNSGAALQHALTDGEDFELLFTISGAKKKSLERAWKRQFARLPLSWAGQITAAKQSSQMAAKQSSQMAAKSNTTKENTNAKDKDEQSGHKKV